MVLLIFSITLIFCASTVSAANIIYVNGTSGDDANTGTSWDHAKKSIKNATGTVQTDGTVRIANGHYSGINNTEIVIARNMNIIGESRTSTIINGSNIHRIFDIINGSNVTFKYLTLTNGQSGSSRGGAIRISADGDSSKPATWIKSSAYISHCIFINNNGYNGAAIGNYGDLKLINTIFKDNTGSNGAAIFAGSRFSGFHIYTTITNCKFINNRLSIARNGGAIFNNDISTMTISHSLFTNNYGSNGGAINNNAVGNMTVTGCTFKDNVGDWGADIVFYGNQYNYAYNIANYNRFLSTGAHGSVHVGDGSVANLTENWWGTNTNPWTSGRITVGLQNNQERMIYDPWVILNVKTINKSIQNNKKATITADLNHLSNGGLVTQKIHEGAISLTVPWGSFNSSGVNHTITMDTVDGIISVPFYANEGPVNPLYNPVKVTATADNYTTNNTESAYITINKSADIYIIIGTNKAHPKINETIKLIYKLGNKGPDTADNIIVTIPLPAGFKVTQITGNGFWNYNPTTKRIIWIMSSLPKGDPYLYITGKFMKIGTYLFNAKIVTDTYNLNTQGVTPLNIKVTDKKANLYLKVTSNNAHPKINETIKLIYKLGNKGPDTADNVIVTIPLPAGFKVTQITGNGFWNYNPTTKRIIWKLESMPNGDPYLYITGKFMKIGTYLFNAKIVTDTYNINTHGVTPLTIKVNKENQNNKKKAVSETLDMQKTGAPIATLIFVIFMVLGALVGSRRQ